MAKRRKVLQHARPHKPVKVGRGSGGSGGNKSTGRGPPPKPKQPQTQSQKQKEKQKQKQKQHQRPTIPFSPEDAILLVGEGDLSFARSLVEHHGCTDVTATVFEKTAAELKDKYPHAPENVAAIETGGGKVVFGVDARTMAAFKKKKPKQGPPSRLGAPSAAVAEGTKDRIIFNFPHVGGKSTDVNRQVRYNQELLVDFFRRADASLAPGGSIVVTLFEGEPYTLWNVRDLARHAGLQVERSFAFPADAYPGYHHARTVGALRDKKGELTGGGWKGEDRPARSYVFFRKGEVPRQPASKKRKRSSSSSSSSAAEPSNEAGNNSSGNSDNGASDLEPSDEET